MRLLGKLKDQQQARALGDYLLTLGIGTQVDEATDGWTVWVENDDHLEQARQQWQQFLLNPQEAKYRQAGPAASAIRSRLRRRERRLAASYVDVRTSWARSIAAPRPLTCSLVAVCLIVAALTAFGYERGLVQHMWFVSPAALPPDPTLWQKLQAIRPLQFWRFVSPVVIHYGPWHLLFNMLWLLDLGGLIERRKGPWKLGALVAGSGAISNFAQYLWTGPGAGGMSGVVYAMFGYVWMKSRHQPHEQMHLQDATVTIMLLWLVICMTGWVGPVGNVAHLTGLAAGVALGAFAAFRHRRRSAR